MILVAGHALVSASARRLCHEAERGIIRYLDSVCFGLVGQDRKTGPKISSRAIFISGLTLAKAVGLTKFPRSDVRGKHVESPIRDADCDVIIHSRSQHGPRSGPPYGRRPACPPASGAPRMT